MPDFSEMTGDYSMEELGEVSGEWGADETAAEAPAAGTSGEQPAGVEEERKEFILEHTTEAEVFIKYGLIEKAIDNLEAIVNHYPDEVESLRRLKDLYLETGNKARAAEKCVDLARLARARGEVDKAMELLAEARAHDPAVKLERGAPAASVETSAEEGEGYSFGGAGSVVVDIDSGPPSSGVELEFGENAAAEKGLGLGAVGEKTDTIEFSLEEGGASEEPAGIELDFEEGGKAQGGEDGGIEFFDSAIRARRGGPGPGKDAGDAAQPPTDSSADDSLFDQEQAFLNQTAPPPTAEEAAGGSALGDDSLEEIFKEFKKGGETQLEAEDYETHYNLGLAYREMELVDEAIAEFQIASKDANRFVECCSHLAVCFKVKGMPKLSIKWCAKALETLEGTPDSPQYVAMLYELGDAYEASGDRDKALETFSDVYGLDASFRDVAERLEKLQE